MRDGAGIRGWKWALALPASLFVVACGASSDGSLGAGGPSAMVLTQAPHCTSESLQIEGTVLGSVISDVRTTNINAGLDQFSMPSFRTPVVDFAPLAANQVALTITWTTGLFDGQAAAASGGSVTLPANHPQAGAKYCVSQGDVGFVSGGSEDGVFKFAISELKAGADCSGATSAVDLRGCFK